VTAWPRGIAAADGTGEEAGGDAGRRSATSESMAGLAVLRLMLLPIAFAGDRLVAHPLVGTSNFDRVFVVACLYALLALLDTRRHGRPVPPSFFVGADLLLVCALTYESGGAFSELHWAFLFMPLGGAILLDPRRTAGLSAVTTCAYLLVALVHPSLKSKALDLVLVQGLYIAWVGIAAVVLSSLLARRRARIIALAAERGSLVAQALDAEDRARQRLANDLHDAAIQNLLAARQDLTEAREGDAEAIDRAESAVRLTLEQLRATVQELHPYVLEQLGLETALEAVAEQHARRGDYRLQMQVDDDAVGVCDQLVFSLASELLANVTRHANATRVRLELLRHPHAISLTVSDDGCGLHEQALVDSLREGHIGLASCRERVHALGGRLDIQRPAAGGTTVRCVIPGARPAAHPADPETVAARADPHRLAVMN
jgi:two-component system NarL family sensor kinase